MSDLSEMGAVVREHRRKQKLTQRQLASNARVSRALLQELETGRLPELGIGKLIRILHAVGLDLRITTLNLRRPTLEDLQEEELESKPR